MCAAIACQSEIKFWQIFSLKTKFKFHLWKSIQTQSNRICCHFLLPTLSKWPQQGNLHLSNSQSFMTAVMKWHVIPASSSVTWYTQAVWKHHPDAGSPATWPWTWSAMLSILPVLPRLPSTIRVSFSPKETVIRNLISPVCSETVPWNVSDYVSQLPTGRSQTQPNLEAALEAAFPPGPQLSGNPLRVDEPATILDNKGNILVWCLQDVLSQSAKVNLGQLPRQFPPTLFYIHSTNGWIL